MQGRRPYPSILIDLFNTAGAAFRRAGLPLVQFDEQELLATAFQETGLRDFGDGSFHEPLRVLLKAYETEAKLTLIGRLAVRRNTLQLLTNRLRLVEDRKRYPAIAQQDIRQPLFIVGLPRTGSTLLHNLLAQDPGNRVPLCWEAMFPSPPPARASRADDPRIAATQKLLDRFDRLAPHFKIIHPTSACSPMECVAIMSHTFASPQFQSMYSVPSYQRWLTYQDWRPVYEFHRQFLQHLQWRCPAERWVLKTPSHLFALEALLAVYPDARIIQMHRHPLQVVASVASLDAVLRRAFSHRVNLKEIGAEALQQWAYGVESAMQVRHGDHAAPGRFFDAYYTDLVREPISTVRRIYAHFGLRFTDELETRMRRFLAEHPKDEYGVHRYSPAQFGLDPDAVATAFRAYLSRFRPEPEVT
jgi:Sulfotransferase family